MIRASFLLLLAACTGEPDDSKPTHDSGEPNVPDCDTVWYKDADGDGFGDVTVFITACEPPGAEVADSTDCDDEDALSYPGAPEDCTTSFDANCDGSITFVDGDLDGTAACEDCDDTNPGIRPGAAEFCDGTDTDCDGAADNDPVDGRVYYLDADEDGYGDVSTGAEACEQPTGSTSDFQDCNDADATISPDADEVCDSIDNDCDGTVDGSRAIDALTWWDDLDGDGYGDDPTEDQGCEAPAGSASIDGDCDDLAADVNPAAVEVCNAIDDDCSGVVDGADVTDPSTWYTDRDSDGWGDSAYSTEACDAPAGYVADAGDCDDLDATAAPDVVESCDEVDNDCDGETDEADASDASTWYVDIDSDGYGDSTVTYVSCTAPAGYVSRSTDCDDTSADVSPSEIETCNLIDDDCDSVVDEDEAEDALTWYADADADGYGDVSVTHVACVVPTGFVADATDCDDADGAISPGDAELCNSIDDDCDSVVDEADAVDATTWYADTDADGYGDAASGTQACTAPAATVEDGTDCDDADPDLHPGATELDCADPVDYNCDGSVGATDADSDGWAACEDCDDTTSAASPDAPELCNGLDDDCDGLIDGATATSAGTWYADTDGDGYGDPAAVDNSCSLPVGYVTNSSDCDDTSARISPADAELCSTTADDDCDGNSDELRTTDCTYFYLDFDEDTYGSTSSVCACSARDLFTADDTDDCDDGDPVVNPAGVEVIGNGVDDDCDGVTDASMLADADTILYGEGENDNLGLALAAGDVNGDGYSDFVAGAYGNDTSASNAGAAFLVLGPTTGTLATTDADASLYGTAISNDAAGYSVSIGDLDGDGYGEILVGAYGNSDVASSAGATYLLYGPVSGTIDLASSDAVFTGATRGDHVGVDVSAIGDTDGDGVRELVLGASGVDTAALNGGSVYVFGSAPLGTLSVSGADAELWGDDAADALGNEVADGGDTNGDGMADLLLGQSSDDLSASGAGTVYILEGPVTSGSVSSTAAAIFTGESASDSAGYSVTSLGDIDDDGYDDIAAGAPDASAGGRVYLVLGPFSGTVGFASADAVFEGPTDSGSGTAVAGVGDIDGDGVPDLLSGGYLDGTVDVDAGGAWVLSGATRGTSTVADDAVATFYGGADDSAGAAVAAAGDFNNDGLPDLLVGGHNADSDGMEVGAAYLILGW